MIRLRRPHRTIPAALPPGIYPSSALAQVIKLTQAGVSEDVIMAYVTNSTSLFNLDPDKIIYLKDIGVPDELVTAMMQRDQAVAGANGLHGLSATAAGLRQRLKPLRS